jgi:hypothetical protein
MSLTRFSTGSPKDEKNTFFIVVDLKKNHKVSSLFLGERFEKTLRNVEEDVRMILVYFLILSEYSW